MNQSTIFRLLIISSCVISILGVSLDSFVHGLLPAALEKAYDEYQEEQNEVNSTICAPILIFNIALSGIMLVLCIGAIIGTIGLLFFKRWSRPISLWLSVLLTLSYPILGTVLYSGWAYMLIVISMMLWGAALAMAYFSEIKVRFKIITSTNVA